MTNKLKRKRVDLVFLYEIFFMNLWLSIYFDHFEKWDYFKIIKIIMLIKSDRIFFWKLFGINLD